MVGRCDHSANKMFLSASGNDIARRLWGDRNARSMCAKCCSIISVSNHYRCKKGAVYSILDGPPEKRLCFRFETEEANLTHPCKRQKTLIICTEVRRLVARLLKRHR
jgi:hypothetical protein